MSAPDPSPRARTALWVRILLFLSLAFNLLVIGLIVGAVTSSGPMERFGRVPADANRTPYVAALDAEDRRGLSRQLRRELRKDRPTVTEWRGSFATALDLLRATPFDAEAFDRHMRTQLDRQAVRVEAGRSALVAYVAEMSEAERAAYATRLEALIERGPYRLKRKDGKGRKGEGREGGN
ncbi:periplasmic heavy metal sensor [Pseudaestuariivita atlantica]|uniref:Uncharacterized protein n=1 Tax=Pseudaestuariivita atlantica TaxID=1317121 RepID=A0A0L1JS61_9RHOB|nr:periplasmic heavy metal sensor [Pseudaestuariivita atlantica]KNG94243.1 hypothetical protein ATO11_08490 [Pseudaestuariivita atlantica]